MNKSFLIIGIIVVVVIGFLVISQTTQRQSAPFSQEPANQTQPQASDNLPKAPDFSLQDYNGKILSLVDFLGKPLVINSWAAWCPFCKKELPDFVTVQKEFGDKVVIIAIDRAEPLEAAKQYSDELGVTNELIFLLDPRDSFYQSIGGFSMPETIFVDTKGNIREHKRGPMDVNEIRQKIEGLLAS